MAATVDADQDDDGMNGRYVEDNSVEYKDKDKDEDKDEYEPVYVGDDRAGATKTRMRVNRQRQGQLWQQMWARTKTMTV